jgi:mono/diheme cytochrome c family protein
MSNGTAEPAMRPRDAAMNLRFVCFLLAFGALVAGAAHADESRSLSPLQQEGKALFEATCVYCHNPRGWGTERLKTRLPEERSVLVDRTDLEPVYIRAVVRNGLISMPAYTPTDLSDAQIDAVAAYLTRNNQKRSCP